MTSLSDKSTNEEIRERFDSEVERFSRLETGQQATIDAPLVLKLVARTAAARLRPDSRILDIGCGAGNFTLRVMQETGPLHCHLVDLSPRMLERARSRAVDAGARSVTTYQTDLRAMEFDEGSFDAILAGAVLHHLREDEDWERVFRLLWRSLKPGGRLYVADLIAFDDPSVHDVMWNQYGRYLTSLGGEAYRDKVFAYIDKEDSPRSLPFQVALLQKSGFSSWEVLHKHGVCACYYADK
jgi:tRNA (cmo5U34)-methyltransferase